VLALFERPPSLVKLRVLLRELGLLLGQDLAEACHLVRQVVLTAARAAGGVSEALCVERVPKAWGLLFEA
jgi:hypothetical protein